MSRANGSKSVQRLAAALHDCVEPPGRDERTANLAAALQDCLDSAVERGAQRAEERIEAKFGPRFDKVDDTLRLFWKQFGGDEKIFRRDEVEGGTPVVESTAGAAEHRLLT